MVIISYERAISCSKSFVQTFLAKCASKSENDYRSMFENFVEDMLTAHNLPEWPAAELVLQVLR
jgi:hypothetical protein